MKGLWTKETVNMQTASHAETGKTGKKIILEYYGAIRESRGLSQESITTCADCIDDLFSELSGRNLIPFPKSILSVAVNDDFCSFGTELKDGDRVVFMTPVAGG